MANKKIRDIQEQLKELIENPQARKLLALRETLNLTPRFRNFFPFFPDTLYLDSSDNGIINLRGKALVYNDFYRGNEIVQEAFQSPEEAAEFLLSIGINPKQLQTKINKRILNPKIYEDTASLNTQLKYLLEYAEEHPELRRQGKELEKDEFYLPIKTKGLFYPIGLFLKVSETEKPSLSEQRRSLFTEPYTEVSKRIQYFKDISSGRAAGLLYDMRETPEKLRQRTSQLEKRAA